MRMPVFSTATIRPFNALVSVVVAVGGLLAVGSSATAAPYCPLSGAYVGAAKPSLLQAFGDWRGSQGELASDYLAQDQWSDIENPTFWLRGWQPLVPRVRVVYGVPILPEDGAMLSAGASGAYDYHFRKLAQSLIAFGQGNAILRLGWEFNEDADPWFAGRKPDGPSDFAAYWRRIVETMRSVPGANFKFDFNPGIGPQDMAAELAWPGDSYVDFVGLDIYDEAWGNYGAPIPDPVTRWNTLLTEDHGLDFWTAFAASHGKPLSVPEWGLRGGTNGGGDDPYFVDAMSAWLTTHAVGFQSYFDFSSSVLTSGAYPLGSLAYQRAFGLSNQRSGRFVKSTVNAVARHGIKGLRRGFRVRWPKGTARLKVRLVRCEAPGITPAGSEIVGAGRRIHQASRHARVELKLTDRGRTALREGGPLRVLVRARLVTRHHERSSASTVLTLNR